MMKKNSINIVEVGPRDGLQNDSSHISTENKAALVERLIGAGITKIEVASFVNPKLVPQMADAEALVAKLPVRKEITYIGLVLNERGLIRALDTRSVNSGINQVGCVALPSDTFGMKNQGQTSAQSVNVAKEILKQAKNEGMSAQVTISSACGCPFEGEVPQKTIVDIATQLAEYEPDEIAIADTIGVGVPSQVFDIFSAVKEAIPHIPLRGHFHNTRNTGVANSWSAIEAGATSIDASIGGLGGCPFAPKSTGNVATEDIVYMLDRSNIKTGVNLERLIDTNEWLEGVLERDLPGMVAKAGEFPKNIEKETELAS